MTLPHKTGSLTHLPLLTLIPLPRKSRATTVFSNQLVMIVWMKNIQQVGMQVELQDGYEMQSQLGCSLICQVVVMLLVYM